MKNEKLNEIIGTIDDKYIVEAMPEKKGRTLSMKKMTKVLIAAAVCLAIVAGSITVGALSKKVQMKDWREVYEQGKFGEFFSELVAQDTRSEISKAMTEWKGHPDIGTFKTVLENNNNVSPDQLTAYPMFHINEFFHPKRYRHSIDMNIFDIRGINKNKAYINNVHLIDDEHGVVIYKIYNDIDLSDQETAYALGMIYRVISEDINGSYEEWYAADEVYYVKDIHSSADYAEVKAGDKISKLLEIDPTIIYDVTRHTFSSRTLDDIVNTKITKEQLYDGIRIYDLFDGYVSCMIYKLLSDGILEVEYEAFADELGEMWWSGTPMENDTERTILNITFHPYSDEPFSEFVTVTSDAILNYLK